MANQVRSLKALCDQAWREVCALTTKVRALEASGSRQRTPSDPARSSGGNAPRPPIPPAPAAGDSPTSTVHLTTTDDCIGSVSSMHTVPVRGAASAAQAVHSGAQTPLGSEALMAQAMAVARSAAPTLPKVKEADEIKLTALPSASLFKDWAHSLARKVANATSLTDEALKWILEVSLEGQTFERLADSGSCGSLDGKLFAALEDKVKGQLALDVTLKQRELQNAMTMMKGRQLLWMIHQHYKVSAVDTELHDYKSFQSLRMRNNNLAAFVHEWETCLMNMSQVPSEAILHSAFFDQISTHPDLRLDIAHYNRLPQDSPDRSFRWLKQIVDAQLERNRADRVRHEFHRVPPAAPAPSKKGDGKGDRDPAPEGACFSWWRTGACKRGKSCLYSHMDNPKTRKQPGAVQNKGNLLCCRNFARLGVCTKPDCALLHKAACPFFVKGTCKKGKDCESPHVKPEMAPKDGSRGRSPSRSGSSSRQPSPRGRKTSLDSSRGLKGNSPQGSTPKGVQKKGRNGRTPSRTPSPKKGSTATASNKAAVGTRPPSPDPKPKKEKDSKPAAVCTARPACVSSDGHSTGKRVTLYQRGAPRGNYRVCDPQVRSRNTLGSPLPTQAFAQLS